jgi:putative transposase
VVCVKPGQRGHVFYRLRIHRGRKNERRSLSEDDYATLITAAHHQLHAPIILIWDGVNTHTSALMRQFTTNRAWLTVVQLPAYAPDLNPVESLWSTLKAGLGNLAVDGVDHLAAIIRTRIKRIQYRPDLIPGFLTQTELSLEPEPP